MNNVGKELSLINLLFYDSVLMGRFHPHYIILPLKLSRSDKIIYRYLTLPKNLCFSGLCFLKSKKAFMKASEEADTALQAFQKADQDMANSRLVIEKVNLKLTR